MDIIAKRAQLEQKGFEFMTSLAQTQADDVLSFTFRIKADINAEHKIIEKFVTFCLRSSELFRNLCQGKITNPI